MKIEYFYHSMWRLETETTSIVLDPYEDIGYPLPQDLTADAVCSSHDHFDHNNFSLINGDFVKIKTIGVYKVGDFVIRGYQTYHDKEKGALRGENIIFKLSANNINILHLGDLGHLLDDDLIKEIGMIDILMIPIGGTYTIDSKEAKQLVKMIKPRILMPMHYQTKGGKVDISNPQEFCSFYENIIKVPKNHIKLDELDFSKLNVYFFEG